MKKLLVLLLGLTHVVILCEELNATEQGPKMEMNNQSAPSAADTIKTYQLPEIVVTATRLEKNLAEIGRSVTIISNEQIKNTIDLSVGEALTRQEGLYTVGAGQNPGMIQSIFVRGAASNHTAFLIDDIRITDPSAVNNALDASELSFVGLDRIEIVRGSHSTLYGSSAIGGVVNMITQKNRRLGFNIDAELRAGTFGKGTSWLSQMLGLNYTGASGLYFNADVLNASIKGMDATVDTVTNPNAFKNRDTDGQNKLDAVAKIGFRNETFDFYLSYKATRQKTDIDDGAYRDDDNYTIDFQRNLFTYGAAYAVSPSVNLKFIGGYSDMKRRAVDDSSVVDRLGNTDRSYFEGTWKGTTLTNELQTSLRLEHLEGVIGIGQYRETMTSESYFFTRTQFGPFELRTSLDTLGLNTTTTNLFTHFDFNGASFHHSLNRFALGLGARLNKHSSFGSSTTVAVNPSVRISDGGLLYASYTTGFNAPSLYQLFAPNRNFSSGITRGNKNLQPERSASYEIGVKQSMGSWHFSLSCFRTVVENVIEYVYLWDKNIGIDTLGNDWRRNDFRGDTYLNLGTQTTSGIEVSFSSRLLDELWLSGNVTFLSGKLKYTPSEINKAHTQGNHVQLFSDGSFVNKEVETSGLVRRPNTLNLSIHYKPFEQWLLRLELRHAGSRQDIFYDSKRGPYGALGTLPVEAYTLVDLSGTYRFSENFTAHARVENVFDTKYFEINGFTTRGRGIYLSIRYGWSAGLLQ